ncbi:MAG: transcription antitermination factor NusB [Gammaproteobacteria bacterium]|nr:MAG: transcription antitermination factor NusB [Gammaproteobacteria bacterium]
MPAEPVKKHSQGGVGARTLARRLAMQALYQWQITGQESAALIEQFVDQCENKRTDLDYFKQLLSHSIAQLDELKSTLEPYLGIPYTKLDPVERSILLIAAYELSCVHEIPPRVVLNEAIELAKRFGADQAHRFVNGVLDKLAKQARS